MRREVLLEFVCARSSVDWTSLFSSDVGYIAYEGRIIVEKLRVRLRKLRFAAERIEVRDIQRVRSRSFADTFLAAFHSFKISTWEKAHVFLTSSEDVQRKCFELAAGSFTWTESSGIEVVNKAARSSNWVLSRLNDCSGLRRWKPYGRRRTVWNDRLLALDHTEPEPLAFSREYLLVVARAQVKRADDTIVSAEPEQLRIFADAASQFKRLNLSKLS